MIIILTLSCSLPVSNITSEHACRAIQVSGYHLEKCLGTYPALLHAVSNPDVTQSVNDLQDEVKFIWHCVLLPKLLVTFSTLWLPPILTLLDEGYCPIPILTVDVPSTTSPTAPEPFPLSSLLCSSFFACHLFSYYYGYSRIYHFFLQKCQRDGRLCLCSLTVLPK